MTRYSRSVLAALIGGASCALGVWGCTQIIGSSDYHEVAGAEADAPAEAGGGSDAGGASDTGATPDTGGETDAPAPIDGCVQDATTRAGFEQTCASGVECSPFTISVPRCDGGRCPIKPAAPYDAGSSDAGAGDGGVRANPCENLPGHLRTGREHPEDADHSGRAVPRGLEDPDHRHLPDRHRVLLRRQRGARSDEHADGAEAGADFVLRRERQPTLLRSGPRPGGRHQGDRSLRHVVRGRASSRHAPRRHRRLPGPRRDLQLRRPRELDRGLHQPRRRLLRLRRRRYSARPPVDEPAADHEPRAERRADRGRSATCSGSIPRRGTARRSSRPPSSSRPSARLRRSAIRSRARPSATAPRRTWTTTASRFRGRRRSSPSPSRTRAAARYYADATSSSFEKRNVRQGRYPLWGYVHQLTHNGTNLTPAHPTAATFINAFTGTTTHTGQDVIQIYAGRHVVPTCAMSVVHRTDRRAHVFALPAAAPVQLLLRHARRRRLDELRQVQLRSGLHHAGALQQVRSAGVLRARELRESLRNRARRSGIIPSGHRRRTIGKLMLEHAECAGVSFA